LVRRSDPLLANRARTERQPSPTIGKKYPRIIITEIARMVVRDVARIVMREGARIIVARMPMGPAVRVGVMGMTIIAVRIRRRVAGKRK